MFIKEKIYIYKQRVYFHVPKFHVMEKARQGFQHYET